MYGSSARRWRRLGMTTGTAVWRGKAALEGQAVEEGQAAGRGAGGAGRRTGQMWSRTGTRAGCITSIAFHLTLARRWVALGGIFVRSDWRERTGERGTAKRYPTARTEPGGGGRRGRHGDDLKKVDRWDEEPPSTAVKHSAAQRTFTQTRLERTRQQPIIESDARRLGASTGYRSQAAIERDERHRIPDEVFGEDSARALPISSIESMLMGVETETQDGSRRERGWRVWHDDAGWGIDTESLADRRWARGKEGKREVTHTQRISAKKFIILARRSKLVLILARRHFLAGETGKGRTFEDLLEYSMKESAVAELADYAAVGWHRRSQSFKSARLRLGTRSFLCGQLFCRSSGPQALAIRIVLNRQRRRQSVGRAAPPGMVFRPNFKSMLG
ncbi:hypothetical protein K438DRAFT_1761803 [Mycena galopus ATCC 62051]|nr:hypothetical protein K438DRAFT_1761803 [Mycena galopus ATCC 62051]